MMSKLEKLDFQVITLDVPCVSCHFLWVSHVSHLWEVRHFRATFHVPPEAGYQGFDPKDAIGVFLNGSTTVIVI